MVIKRPTSSNLMSLYKTPGRHSPLVETTVLLALIHKSIAIIAFRGEHTALLIFYDALRSFMALGCCSIKVGKNYDWGIKAINITISFFLGHCHQRKKQSMSLVTLRMLACGSNSFIVIGFYKMLYGAYSGNLMFWDNAFIAWKEPTTLFIDGIAGLLFECFYLLRR